MVSKLNVDEKYEKAITAALGDAIDVLVLENDTINPENLQEIIDSTKERVALIGKSTIESIEVFKTFNEDGIVGWAPETIHNTSEYKDVIDALLGNFLIVQDLKIAFNIHKKN